MKVLKNMSRRKKGILALALAAAVGTAGTLAYYSNKQELKNPLAVKNTAIEVIEKFNPADKWLPGEQKEKLVSFKNTGDIPVLLRFNLEITLQDEKGNEVKEIPPNLYQLFFDETMNAEWTDKSPQGEKAGYYYYNKVLQPNEATGETLTSVKFSPELSNDGHDGNYEGYTLSVHVLGESIVADADAASDEWNQTLTMEGLTATWK